MAEDKDDTKQPAWQAARYSPPLTITMTPTQEAELMRDWNRLAPSGPLVVLEQEPAVDALEAAQFLREAAHSIATTTKDWDEFEALCLKVLQAAGARVKGDIFDAG